jgi:hypothetical protein
VKLVLLILAALALGAVLAFVVVNLVTVVWYAVGALLAYLFPWWGWDPQLGRHRWDRQP